MMILIASVGQNNELGRGGDLCWHIREDLRHFKELTLGHPVIMGRKTWESLPRKPLPGRLNIIITKNAALIPQNQYADNVVTASSLEEALRISRDRYPKDAPFIIGGESVYREAMPLADTLEITRIYDSDARADKFFPEISDDEWEVEKAGDEMSTPEGLKFRYITLKRKEE